jgi:hypothetical protein
MNSAFEIYLDMDTIFTELDQVITDDALSWSALSSELNWNTLILDGSPMLAKNNTDY